MKLLKGQGIAKEIYTEVAHTVHRIRAQGLQPRLGVVLIGDDPASLSYIAVKKKQALQLGIGFDFFDLAPSLSQSDLCHNIVEINRRPGLGGMIIQLPLPPSLDRQQVLDCVLPVFDIDGLTSINQARLAAGSLAAYVPPTPAGILALLKHYKIPLQNRHVLIVGAGELVGKPLSRLLVQQGITVSVATAETKDLTALTKHADVIVTGVGKPGIVRGDMVKKGVVVVDAGTSLLQRNGKTLVRGDVDFPSVAKKAFAITPVPGGVGPLTVAMLYKNFAISCRRLFEQ